MRRTTFFILCLEGATLSFNVAAASALIPSISREFGVPQFVTGRIVWLYMVPYGIAALFYGPLVRIINAKRVELVCFFLFCLSNLLAAFSPNILTLFAARFLTGVFGASVIPLAIILIGKDTQAEHRGKSVGIFFSATFVASLLGLFLSGLLAWRWLFLIPAIFGILLWIHMWMYLPDFKPDTGKAVVHYPVLFKNRAAVSLLAYIFFISMLYHGVQQWLAVYFSSTYNFSQFAISMLITLTSLSGIIGEAAGGLFSDMFGRSKTAAAGILLMALSACVLVFKLPLFFLASVMVIWGLGWALNHAGLSTMLTDLPEAFLNESASLNSSMRFISGGIGMVCAGVLMQKSFTLGFLASCAGLTGLVLLRARLLGVK